MASLHLRARTRGLLSALLWAMSPCEKVRYICPSTATRKLVDLVLSVVNRSTIPVTFKQSAPEYGYDTCGIFIRNSHMGGLGLHHSNIGQARIKDLETSRSEIYCSNSIMVNRYIEAMSRPVIEDG